MSQKQIEKIKPEDEDMYKKCLYDVVHHPNLKAQKLKLMNVDEEKSAGSLLWSFLKQIRPGANLVSLTCPSIFLSPYSYLEARTDYAAPIPYLLFGLNSPDVLQVEGQQERKKGTLRRFVNLSKWILCNLSFTPNQGVARMKPFNPILGEQFHCLFDHSSHKLAQGTSETEPANNTKVDGEFAYFKNMPQENGDFTYCMSEQVRHHPPITSQHMENAKHGFTYEMTTVPEPEFSLWHNYLKVAFTGDSEFSFLMKDNDKYIKERNHISVPPIITQGIVWGTPAVHHEGFCIVKNLECGFKMISKCFADKDRVLGFIMKTDANDKISRTKKEKDDEHKELEKMIVALDKNPKAFSKDNPNMLMRIHGSLNEELIFEKIREPLETPFGYPSPYLLDLKANGASEALIAETATGFSGTGNSEKIDFKVVKFPKKIVKPIEKQENCESRKVWHLVAKSLWSNDLNGASELKHDLEEAQRARRKTMDSFTPQSFICTTADFDGVASLNYSYLPEKNTYSFK